MNTRFLSLLIFVLGVMVFVSPAQAQRHAAIARRGGARVGVVRGSRARGPLVGSAFEPYYFPDYFYEPETVEAPPTQIVIEQAAPPPPPAPAPVAHDSLVIELQGDHWVRITGSGPSPSSGQSNQPGSEPASNPPSAPPPANPQQTQAQEPPVVTPPAVLVFRDGHEEEMGKYSIIGTTIYTNADYWSSGTWTRQIKISELDVPATLKLNRERGTNFRLPSGPNEVMVRP